MVHLLVDLLFLQESDIRPTPGIIRTPHDPASGAGGILSVSEEYVWQPNPDARLELFGQDYNVQVDVIKKEHDEQAHGGPLRPTLSWNCSVL